MTGLRAKTQLTSDPDEFRATLQPGDVLLYDSIAHADAGLVQWADAAPVNHASLVLDAEWVIEANRTRRADQAVAEGQGAVRRAVLEPRLDVPGIRTVTALRHVAVSSPGEAVPVVTRALELEGTGTFSYLDIAALIPAGLRRGYRDDLGGPGLLARMSKTFLGVAEKAAVRARTSEGSGMNCSEFIYRCFVEARPAPFALTTDRPLHPRLAHRVSPGDLWRSNSLRPITVLHRPPDRPWTWPGGAPERDRG